MNKHDWVWDIETYPNVCTFFFANTVTKKCWLFEISDRRNDSNALRKFCGELYKNKDRLVGFNSVGFDYPVLHAFLRDKTESAAEIYAYALSIIEASEEERMFLTVREDKMFIPNVDLYLLNHFNNKAKATGLKALEFNMRSDTIEDLPFSPGSVLTNDQIDVLIEYNKHDVMETYKFYEHNKEAIKFREEMSERYGKSFLNFSDTKIGSEIFIHKLEEAQPGICFKKVGNRMQKQQTHHKKGIRLKDCILDYVKFERPEFNAVLDYLRAQTIKETKGVFTDLTAVVDGLPFVFGSGGIHASVESCSVISDDQWMIVDLDVR